MYSLREGLNIFERSSEGSPPPCGSPHSPKRPPEITSQRFALDVVHCLAIAARALQRS